MTDRTTNYGNPRYLRRLDDTIWYENQLREQRRMWDNYNKVYRYGMVRGILKVPKEDDE